MKLVEIITGLGTSEETLRRTHGICKQPHNSQQTHEIVYQLICVCVCVCVCVFIHSTNCVITTQRSCPSALASAMGKVTTQSKDVPGFIANRLLMPYINEAIFALQVRSTHTPSQTHTVMHHHASSCIIMYTSWYTITSHCLSFMNYIYPNPCLYLVVLSLVCSVFFFQEGIGTRYAFHQHLCATKGVVVYFLLSLSLVYLSGPSFCV